MKPKDYNHPDITAYVMDELDSAGAARMKGLIACSPEAREEYNCIKRAVTALHAGASIPARTLHPSQKETVLAMSQKPGRAPKIAPFTVRPKRKSIFNSTVFRLAAAACLTAGAFLIGHQTAMRPLPVTLAKKDTNQSATVPAFQSDPVMSPTFAEKKIVAVIAPNDVRQTAADTDVTSVVSPPPVVAPSVATTREMKVSSPIAFPAPAFTSKLSLASFIIAADHPQTSITLQPDLMRPTKTATNEFAGIILAAPMLGQLKTVTNVIPIPRKTEHQPKLVIHSWKTEIASCPWDSTRRLMRFVIQIPVDQTGIDFNDASYRLAVKFDPAQVQGYRLVTEKHIPPGGGSNLATRFAWYEIVPVRNFSPTRDQPVLLGVMELAQPVAVKESQSLRLMDRGLSWSEAREDFAFETAMIGFNLLLQGAENIGSLNYKLVLDLAEQSRGEDRHGERSKFIKAVEEAQNAAGL